MLFGKNYIFCYYKFKIICNLQGHKIFNDLVHACAQHTHIQNQFQCYFSLRNANHFNINFIKYLRSHKWKLHNQKMSAIYVDINIIRLFEYYVINIFF